MEAADYNDKQLVLDPALDIKAMKGPFHGTCRAIYNLIHITGFNEFYDED